MRIAHITPSYYPATYWGGTIFTTLGLNNALSCLPDVELRVLTTDTAGPRVSDKLDIESLDGSYSNYKVDFSRRILGHEVAPGLLAKLPSIIHWADVIQLTGTYSFPTIPTLALARFVHKPLVWSLHGAVLDAYVWKGARKRKLKRVWEQICNFLCSPDLVTLHVTSDKEKEVSQLRIPDPKAVKVQNGVEVPSRMYHRASKKNDKLTLIFIGRIAPKKGIENLLHAMQSLSGHPEIVLKIYGTGDRKYTASLVNLAKKHDIFDRTVFFMGYVDGDEKKKAFLAADLSVVPSITENFGMVIAEALAHGLPVIASHGTPWERIEQKNCGLWIDNDPATIADAILEMREKDLLRMGENGWRWMREEYSWEAIANQMYHVYQKSIQKVA